MSPILHLPAGTTVEIDGKPTEQQWRPDVFVQVVASKAPRLRWADVIRQLDHPTCLITSSRGLEFILQTYNLATQGAPFPWRHIFTCSPRIPTSLLSTVPDASPAAPPLAGSRAAVKAFPPAASGGPGSAPPSPPSGPALGGPMPVPSRPCPSPCAAPFLPPLGRPWRNRSAQLNLIRLAVSASEGVVDWAHIEGTPGDEDGLVVMRNLDILQHCKGPSNWTAPDPATAGRTLAIWRCLDLVQTLLVLSESKSVCGGGRGVGRHTTHDGPPVL